MDTVQVSLISVQWGIKIPMTLFSHCLSHPWCSIPHGLPDLVRLEVSPVSLALRYWGISSKLRVAYGQTRVG